ncbi:Eco57I restriction-modification methylase domain-containing protein [Halorubrum ezzemoulense]|uniref:Eco57I restriction-modification methylase domain-containing protein n=1 Tax=Halorubrum ezzemoulense TaxID=337243 RepID=UPI0015C65B78|nr:DNA methyltransferase [Halorubrum ezzemoulense]
MTLQQIKAADIAGWDSLEDIAASFEKRGLEEQPDLGDENKLVLQLTDTEFITIVDAQAGETATDHKPDNRTRRTNLVATNDFENFTFLTRVRSWEGQQHGRIKHQKLEFSKEQFESDEGKKNTVLKKLNAIEYGSADAIRDTLYDTKEVVKEFYEQFEELRTDLVQEVSGIPDDRGDAKGRYVQVILDRMIFLYFIQEKRLLDREPKYLREHHDDKADAGEDVYEEFYHPLFFDYLAEDNQSREFGNLPYLNGGLFSKNPIEEEFPDAKLGESTERTNELFDDILDFLSDWNWNVDERLDIVDPKNLSPAILGHIFEQTVNQKEMGAYYTPEEITGFMSRRTIHPYLLDHLNETVDAEYDSIDEVFSLAEPKADTGEQAAAADGGHLTAQAATEGVETSHVETLYHDVLTDASVLDPAVGSGAFLLAAQDVLIDVYLQCLEFFEQVDTEGRGFELAGKTRDVLEEVGNGPSATSLYAKREIILNNLYGVDIDDGAVEICKLRLWLSMVADIEDEPDEVAPLPNIDFNIRQGNSLVGQVDAELEINSEGDSELDAWELKQRFREVQKAIREHKQAESGEKAQDWRKKAEERIEKNRDKFDEKLRGEFQDAGLDIGLEELREWDPFHWPLEFAGVFDEGGFDVIIGNPPWDMLYANRDDFFIRYDEQFRKYPSKTKDEVMGHLLSDPEVAWEWEEYKESIESRTDYFTKGDTYQLQSPVVGGRTMPTKNELSALFLERVYNLSDDGMEVSLLLPGTIFGGVMGKDLREYLLDNTDVEYLIGFENKGIFDQIHQQYRFAILDFTYGSETTDLRGIFNQNTTDILENINQRAVSIPREVLRNYSPEGRIFPSITSQQEVSVLEKVVDHPSLDADTNDAWSVNMLTKEFVESTDKDRLLTDPENAEYPVYGGKNFHQFEHDNSFTEGLAEPKYWSRGMYDPQNSAQYRVREKNFNRGHLKRALYDSFGGPKTSKSQKQFVNDLLDEHRDEDLKEEDMLLDCTEYRIAIRDVSRSRDERTIISTVLPKDIVCLHTINTLKPYSIEPEEEHLSESPIRSSYVRRFTDKELFAATGLLNSIAFDFLMRTKVETHIIKREFLESQMPRLTDGDDWFHYISERAARLNCYGEEFAEMRDRLGGIDAVTDDAERRTVQAEVDAAAFHAYGLEHDDVAFVLDDFHRVSNPRIMTEDYFDAVLEKYDELAEEGPYE